MTIEIKTDKEIFYEVDNGNLTQEKWVKLDPLYKTLNAMKNIKIQNMKKSRFRNEKDNIYIKIINDIVCRLKKTANDHIEKGESYLGTVRKNETYCKNCDKFTTSIKNGRAYTCQNCGKKKSLEEVFPRTYKQEMKK